MSTQQLGTWRRTFIKAGLGLGAALTAFALLWAGVVRFREFKDRSH